MICIYEWYGFIVEYNLYLEKMFFWGGWDPKQLQKELVWFSIIARVWWAAAHVHRAAAQWLRNPLEAAQPLQADTG